MQSFGGNQGLNISLARVVCVKYVLCSSSRATVRGLVPHGKSTLNDVGELLLMASNYRLTMTAVGR